MHHRASGASAIEVLKGAQSWACCALEQHSLLALARFVLGLSSWALLCFCGARCFQFAHPFLDSLATKLFNQSNRDSVSRAHVAEQEIAVRVNRPVLERVGIEPRAPGG